MIGLSLRATMDLDATIVDIELSESNLTEIINDILTVETDESFILSFQGVEEIREGDDYPGFRVKLLATFEQIRDIITIDVTFGDIITPREVDFSYKLLFTNEDIELLSYPMKQFYLKKLKLYYHVVLLLPVLVIFMMFIFYRK